MADQPTGHPRAQGARWAAVGRCDDDDPATCGRVAARGALAGGDDPKLLLVLAPHDHELPALLAAVRACAPGVPVAGASTRLALDDGGPGDGALVVLALGGDGFEVGVAAVPEATGDPRGAGAEAAACVGDVAAREHRVLLLLADSRIPDRPELLRGVYSVAGAGTRLAGALVGDPAGRSGVPLHEGRVLHGGVVAVAIGSDAPIGLGLAHGLAPEGEPLVVTAGRRGRLLALDDRPAAAVLRERHARMPLLGVQRRLGPPAVRVAVDDGRLDGGVACDVPSGALLWAMGGSVEDVAAAAGSACATAVAGLAGAPPTAVLLFDCLGRRDRLGPAATAGALAQAVAHAGGAPVAGLFATGQLARTSGPAQLHQQTLVALALA